MTSDQRREIDALPPDVRRWVLWFIEFSEKLERRRKSSGRGSTNG
jgi:hypothetical protein